MSASFDIFQLESGGGVRWLEAAETLGDARARVQELVRRSPGEYFVMDSKTGNKIVIQPDGQGRVSIELLAIPGFGTSLTKKHSKKVTRQTHLRR